MEKKLLILDGTSLLAEAYYNTLTKEVELIQSLKESGKKVSQKEEEEAFATLLQSKKGTYINGVQGFFRILFDALDKRNPSHLTIAWGAQRENNFRRKIFPGYKDDGKIKDKALLAQEKMVKSMLFNMGIHQLESFEYEALDIAGSLAEKFKNEVEIEILARNTMSLQFTDIATVWFKTPNFKDIIRKHNLDDYDYPKGSVRFDKEFLLTYKKLKPEQLPDYRALIGNSYSRIPGVKSVGEVTTSALLEEYGSIEALYSDIDACTTQSEIVDFGKDLTKYLTLPFNPIPLLIKGRDEAFLGKKLAIYKRDSLGKGVNNSEEIKIDNFNADKINRVEIVKELKNIGLSPIKGNITKKISEIIEEVNFSSLIASYHPFIFSPTSPTFIGEFSSLDSIPAEITTENEIRRIIKFTDEAIIQFGDKIKIDTDSTSYYSNDAIQERLKEKEEAEKERQIAIITNAVNSQKCKESQSTQMVWVANTDTQVESSEEEYEEYEECELNKDEATEDLKTTDVSSSAKQDSNSNKVNNLNFNSSNEIKPNKKKGLSLIESITINRYYCSQCNEEFTLIGSEASFCTRCGASTVDVDDEVNSKEEYSEIEINIPIAEKSNCELSDLELKKDKENLNTVINVALSL